MFKKLFFIDSHVKISNLSGYANLPLDNFSLKKASNQIGMKIKESSALRVLLCVFPVRFAHLLPAAQSFLIHVTRCAIGFFQIHLVEHVHQIQLLFAVVLQSPLQSLLWLATFLGNLHGDAIIFHPPRLLLFRLHHCLARGFSR